MPTEFAAIDTPLGDVALTAAAEGGDTSSLDVEVFTCELRPDLPDGMHVDGCRAALWGFTARRRL